MCILIDGLALDNNVLLAPMSGITDQPFRRLARRMGAGLVVSEMIASRDLVRQTRDSVRRSRISAEEAPAAVQLAGTDPGLMAEAARLAADRGAVLVDINYGCPAKNVVGKKAGSALMRDLPLATAIVDAVVTAVAVPVTVKMRLGWDDSERNAADVARAVTEAGARMITVHGRTRAQKFRGTADWRAIRAVVDAVPVPVIANGDIRSTADARRCLAASGAAGVMVGRGCQGRPWLAGQIAAELAGRPWTAPTVTALRALVHEHFEAMLAHYGRESGLRNARKHLGWYAHGQAGGAAFRQVVNNTMDGGVVVEALYRFFGSASAAAA